MHKKKIFLITVILLTALLLSPINNLKVLAIEESIEEYSQQVNNIESYNYISNFSSTLLLTSNSEILCINSDDITSFDNDDLETGVYIPKFALQTTNNIAVFDSLNRIQIYTNDFEYVKTFNYVDAETRYNIGNIVCVAKDYAGNLFFADATAQKILYLSTSLDAVTEITIDEQIVVDSETKIFVNANGNLLAIKSQNQVYVYDILANLILANIDATADELYFDYLNNLFVLYQNNISKYSNIDYSFVETKNFDINIKSASIDIETGTFYFLSDKIYTFADTNFAENASFEVEPISVETTELLPQQIQFAKASKDCLLYATCVSFSSSDEITENQLVMILDKNIAQNNNMWYCLTNINGVQKQGYITKNNLTVLENETQNAIYKTICKNVELKTYPTDNAGVSTIIVPENTQLCVLGTVHNFVDSTGKSYFAVQTNNGVGYIEQKYLTETVNFESEMKDLVPLDNGQTKFIAYILTTISLMIATIFVCIIIGKKKNSKA